MQLNEGAKQVIDLIQSLLPLMERLVGLAKNLGVGKPRLGAQSYENLFLSLTLRICDCGGSRAVVLRKQRVLFHTNEAGVITNPVWGDGEPVQRFRVTGAARYGVRHEGARRVILLGLDERPAQGSIATLTSEREITGGFLKSREYFEATIERPTRHFSMKVLFPSSRPPTEVYLLMLPGGTTKRIHPRLNRSGRASITWQSRELKPSTTYSLRWTW